MSSSASTAGLDDDNRMVTARIGPNSPMAPAAVRNEPKRVSSMPRSRSIGSSVPIAVVVSARPTSRLEMTKPSSARTAPTPRPSASEIAQPAAPRFSGAPLSLPKSIS